MNLSLARANALFVLLVSVAMTAVMSFGILLLRLGWQADFLRIWLGDFLIGCGLSIPTGFTVVPLIRRWIDQQIRPADSGTDPAVDNATTKTTESKTAMNAAVRELVGHYADALNTRQADAFAALFHPDAEYINVIGVVIRGRPALAAWHKPLFDGSGRDRGLPDFSRATIEISRYDVQPVVTGVVVVNVYWTLWPGAMGYRPGSSPNGLAVGVFRP
jgi:hypothetical protein